MKNEIQNNKKKGISAVIMASGHGKRFGSNKLLTYVKGIHLIEYLFRALPSEIFERVCVVSRYDEILCLADKYNYYPVFNPDMTDDTALTIRMGIKNIRDGSIGCMFFTGDQPLLKKESIVSLVNLFWENSDNICVLKNGEQRGNPVIFPASLFEELINLPKNGRGNTVIKAHEDIVLECEIENPEELMDVDFESDLDIITEYLQININFR